MTRRKLYTRLGLIGLMVVVGVAAATWGPGTYRAARVHQLTSRLADAPDFTTRVKTIFQLGEMGAAARPAAPALILLLEEDADPHVRSSAAIALGKIGDDRSLPHIQRRMAALEADGKKDTSHFKACQWAVARLTKG